MNASEQYMQDLVALFKSYDAKVLLDGSNCCICG